MYSKKYQLNYRCPKASIQKHEKMENFNFLIYKQFLTNGELRWATIALFYYALHKTQKMILLNSTSVYPRGHTRRRFEIDHILSNIYPGLLVQYMNLEERSCQARYCPVISLRWDKEPQKTMINTFLTQTENYFSTL